ncbi:galanin receptor 2b-like [Apostichopus japonicus]|uniref:galanin receptor 2b-like n=1 Tax=Stichopus japonicus TaxID=307972 RepID=UPI003AB3F99C
MMDALVTSGTICLANVTEENQDASSSTGPSPIKFFFVIIALLGIIDNGTVLFVFYKIPQLRITTNILIGNQSIVDFIGSVLIFLIFVFPGSDPNQLERMPRNPMAAKFLCKIWFNEFLYWAVASTSTTNLVFLTIERYLAVVFPHVYRKRASRSKARIVCAFAWVIGFLQRIYFLFISQESFGGCSVKNVPVVGYITLFSTLIIPVALMTFVYSSIFQALRPKPSKHGHGLDQDVQGSVALATSATYGPASSNFDYVLQVTTQPVSDVCRTDDNAVAAGDDDDDDVDETVSNYKLTQRQTRKRKRAAKERARRNVLVTMFIVCMTYITCWTPNQILYFHHNVAVRHDWNGAFHQLTILLAASNVCTNPIIYTLKYRSFQNGLKKVFKRENATDDLWVRRANSP